MVREVFENDGLCLLETLWFYETPASLFLTLARVIVSEISTERYILSAIFTSY